MIAIVMAAAAAVAQPAAAPPPAPPPASVQVMVLGSYHFDNPGRDVVNIKADDVRTPKRQRELAAAGFGSAREEGPDRAEPGLPVRCRHDEHPGARGEGRDERVGGPALPVRELGLLGRVELGD